jgi:hypothetical protein
MTASWHLLAGFVVDPAMGLLVAWDVAASVFLAWP